MPTRPAAVGDGLSSEGGSRPRQRSGGSDSPTLRAIRIDSKMLRSNATNRIRFRMIAFSSSGEVGESSGFATRTQTKKGPVKLNAELDFPLIGNRDRILLEDPRFGG